MQCGQLIDELTYSCYKYNREQAPDVSPERWGLVFSQVDQLEQRYQSELIKAKA